MQNHCQIRTITSSKKLKSKTRTLTLTKKKHKKGVPTTKMLNVKKNKKNKMLISHASIA